MSLGTLLFGENKNKTDFKQAAYDKHLKNITAATYDQAYGDLADYLNENYQGGAAKAKFDTMTSLNNAEKNSLANYKNTRYNVFGDGLVGSILNPVAQTVSGLTDLVGMGVTAGTKELGKNLSTAEKVMRTPAGAAGVDTTGAGNLFDKMANVEVSNPWTDANSLGVTRDAVSDLGAAGTTALNALTYGKLGTLKAPTSMAQSVVRQGLLGAGYGATGALRTMGSENFDPQTLLLSTAIGGGFGGLTGAGTYKLGELTSSLDKKAISQKLSDYAKTGGKNEYQQALETLKAHDVDTTSAETLRKTGRKAIVKAARTATGADVNETTSAIKEAMEKILDGGSGSNQGNFAANMAKATEPVTAKLDLSQIPRVPAKNFQEALANAKNNIQATKLYNSLYNSKLGRLGLKAAPAAAVAGGAYGLSRLGQNNNNNEQTLADYYATLGQE